VPKAVVKGMATAIDRPVMSDRHVCPVVVTGVGCVTSLGWNRTETFNALCQGRSGLRTGSWNHPKTGDQPWAGFPVDVPPQSLSPLWPDPVFPILQAAATEALADAGLEPQTWNPTRVAVAIGLSKGAVRLQSQWAHNVAGMANCPAAQRLGLAAAAPSAGASFIANLLGTTGPILAPITACATGLTAIRHAVSLLQNGVCDIALAGAADASLEPAMHAAFARMKSLAEPHFPHQPPQDWIRPWSPSRNGFLIGEGGAVFVLERARDVQNQGRTGIARITRMVAGAEAYHPTRPEGSGQVLTRLVQQATQGRDTEAVHLHMTATRGYDQLEARAVAEALGPQADACRVMASKTQIGHCLGAAGAVEVAICCEALRRQILPPFHPTHTEGFSTFGQPIGPQPLATPTGSILKIVAGFGGHLEICRFERF